MVGKKTLKDYELNDIYEYYDMCINSRLNGNIEQAKRQALKLTKDQRFRFLEYIDNLTNGETEEFFIYTFI